MKFTSPYPLAPYHTILKRQIPTDSGILNCLKAILFNEVIGQKITLFSLPENIIQTSIRIVIEKKEGWQALGGEKKGNSHLISIEFFGRSDKKFCN